MRPGKRVPRCPHFRRLEKVTRLPVVMMTIYHLGGFASTGIVRSHAYQTRLLRLPDKKAEHEFPATGTVVSQDIFVFPPNAGPSSANQ